MTHPTASPVESRLTSPVRTALTIIAGAALMTIAAKTQIPFWPVPMTLHTLAVMAFAIAFGPRIAVAIFLTYLAAGAVGLPVFSGSPERGIGLAYMAGPTGGYLAGYLVASWLVGTLALGKSTLGRMGAMLTRLATVYALGAAWLAAYVPLDRLLSVGVVPFLLGDLMKIGLVAVGTAILSTTLAQLQGKRP